ncbi:hypothetical protein MTBBW1_160023 [Desulfamplus magnetovallimortis]|uniref:Uncharacterized protein n=1 Tax=Desulfamplus magnetovallimortis TaxID=1246637 RepID=A0A1W1H8P1_9BACT|nr:hypothetical protein MTBBW1_160023 [Desulfamplus magnetovallimortis]
MLHFPIYTFHYTIPILREVHLKTCKVLLMSYEECPYLRLISCQRGLLSLQQLSFMLLRSATSEGMMDEQYSEGGDIALETSLFFLFMAWESSS